LYLEDGVKYRVILKNVAGGTVKTDDDVRCPIFSQGAIGLQFYPQTTAESSAGVTPTNYQYEPGNVLRYGTNTTPGTTDMTTAIANAALSNSVVYIPAGTYMTDQINYTSDMTFYGDGINITILKLNDSQDTPVFFRADGSLPDNYPTINAITQMDNVEIRDLTIDGNQANQSAPTGTSMDYCIVMQRVVVCRVSNVEVKNGKTGGITLHQCRSGIVENCVVDDCVQTGSVQNQIQAFRDFTGGSFSEDDGGKHILRNNVVSGTIGYGVAMHQNFHTIIEGNVVTNCLNSYGAESCFSGKIINNAAFGGPIQINDTGSGSPVGVIVANNALYETIQSTTTVGVRASAIQANANPGCVISNNTIYKAQAVGAGPTWGTITLVDCDFSTVSGNIVKTPVDGGDNEAGIIIWSSPNCIIADNYIESFEHYGIHTSASAECKITGNSFFQTSGSAASNGWHVITSSDCILEANSFEFFTNGIVTDSPSTGIVVGNIKYPNTTTPIVETAQGAIVYESLPRATEIVTASNGIGATESGKTFFLNSATEFASTLPAPAQGLKYTFIITAAPSGAAYTIVTASSANIMSGTVSDIVGETVYATAQDLITFADGVSVIGDRVDVESDGTNWYYRAVSGADGGITTGQT